METDHNSRALQDAIDALMANDLAGHMGLVAPGVHLTMSGRTLGTTAGDYERWFKGFLADRGFGDHIQIVAATMSDPLEETFLVVAFHSRADDDNPVQLTSTFVLQEGLIVAVDLRLPGTPGMTWQYPS